MGKNDPRIDVPVIKAADETGFIGFDTDPTPNEHYTVSGVTSGKPTPETDKKYQGAVKAYQAEGIEGLEHSTEIADVDSELFTRDRGSREDNLAADPSITVPTGSDDDDDVEEENDYSDYTYAELQEEVSKRDLDVSKNSSGDTLKAALAEDDRA